MTFERKPPEVSRPPAAGAASIVEDPSYEASPIAPSHVPGVRPDPTALLPWMDDLAIGQAGASARTETASHEQPRHAPPTRVADSGANIPTGARYDPRWVAMAEGVIHERVAPGTVRLPDQVVKGLDEAWARSQKSGHEERGGNIVKTYWGGEYDFRHGGDKDSTDKDSWMPDRKDKRTGQEFIGTYHTHDYAGEKHEYPYGTFSDSDVANIADMEDRLKLVRSGDRTFMLSRTQEFDAMAKKYENDPEAMAAFQMQIRDTYNAAYKKALGGDASRNPEALEAGVRAAAQKYHLLYYSGQGAMLRRVAGGPPAK